MNDFENQAVVAHIQKVYLPYSEIFVYRFLSHFKRIVPVVITQKLKNSELFPIDHLIDISIKRFTASWMKSQFYKLLGRENFFMEKALNEYNAKLVHAHFGPRGVESLEVARRMHLPLVTTFYGYDISTLVKEDRWKKAYRRVFDYGSLFLAEGSCMAQKIRDAGCPSSKVKIQHLGVCVDLYENIVREKVDGKIVVLFCGRFTEKKGISYALEAFSRVVRKNPELEMRLVGDGEGYENVLKKIRDLKIQDKVKLLGILPFPKVAEQLLQADIFIHPSVTASNGDSEGGAPTILLEASAAGVPVVSTLHADIPEVVLHELTGFLAKEKDVEGLSHYLEVLVNDSKLRKTMGEKGRQHISAHYNIEKEVSKLEELYFSTMS